MDGLVVRAGPLPVAGRAARVVVAGLLTGMVILWLALPGAIVGGAATAGLWRVVRWRWLRGLLAVLSVAVLWSAHTALDVGWPLHMVSVVLSGGPVIDSGTVEHSVLAEALLGPALVQGVLVLSRWL